MNIPTDAIVMTVVLIAGFIYFKMQKEDTKPKEIESDEEEWLNTSHFLFYTYNPPSTSPNIIY